MKIKFKAMKTFLLWLMILFGFQYATGQACTATISADRPTTFCPGGSVVLTAVMYLEGGKETISGNAFLWSTGDTTSSITVFKTGSYSVTITNEAGCRAISPPANVMVNNQFQLSFNCPGDIVVSPSSLQGTIINYPMPEVSSNCLPFSLQQTSGLASGSVFPIGTTANIFKATDGSGNYATCSFKVTVTDPYCSKAVGNKKVYVCHMGETICAGINEMKTHLEHGDYLGSCNKDNMNKTEISTQNLPAGIEVYPNPSRGKFTLKLNYMKAPKGVVTIMDSKGSIVERRMLYETLYPATIVFDLGINARGNYRVKVETKLETFSAQVVDQ
jgi:hypothetical protein